MRILRPKQVAEVTGLSLMSIYAKGNKNTGCRYDPTFPRRVKIGPSASGYVESEIQEWLQNRVNAQRQENAA